MADYPTLTVYPSAPIVETKEDPAIKTESEAGYVHTRLRYSRSRRNFKVPYENMSNADKVILDAFCDTVHGSVTSFNWVHPLTGVTYVVRFDKRPEFTSREHDGDGYRWDTEFTLVQV